MNLKKGFLTEDLKTYHPGLSQVIIINEPDLKLPNIDSPRLWAKGIVSAVDGMLDAEKELHVGGKKINFTATFSFGICKMCSKATDKPALGQMRELQLAFEDPSA